MGILPEGPDRLREEIQHYEGRLENKICEQNIRLSHKSRPETRVI